MKGPTSQLPASMQQAFGRAPAKALKKSLLELKGSEQGKEGTKVPSFRSRTLGNDSDPPVSPREEGEEEGEHRKASKSSRVDQSIRL